MRQYQILRKFHVEALLVAFPERQWRLGQTKKSQVLDYEVKST